MEGIPRTPRHPPSVLKAPVSPAGVSLARPPGVSVLGWWDRHGIGRQAPEFFRLNYDHGSRGLAPSQRSFAIR